MLLNTVGSRVLTASKPAREYELILNVSQVTPGVYIVLIETGGKVIRQKITIY